MLDLSPSRGSFGIGEKEDGMNDLVGCSEKGKRKKEYPGKSVSKVLKPTAGSGLVARLTLLGLD